MPTPGGRLTSAMPKRLRPPRSTALVGVAAALALVAAACGSGGTDGTDTAGSATTAAPATTADAAPDSTAAAPDSTAATAGPEAPAPAENLFAPVDVVNIADGSTINLADQLAGDDRPVLLWFFAPH